MRECDDRGLWLMKRACMAFSAAVLLATGAGSDAAAATSATYDAPSLTARLITAEDRIRPGARTISAALSLKLGDGWKTYWRSPGEVGLPPEIEWTGSSNLESAEIQWPAPKRFRAFGIENFGYDTPVTYPIRVMLDEPGQALDLRATVALLVCSDVCVPLNFDLSLSLPSGTGIDAASAAEIGAWSARVPEIGPASGIELTAAVLENSGEDLVVELRHDAAFSSPDIFPELGEGTSFGKPDIRLSQDRRTLWASIPVLALADPASPLAVTVTDGKVAVTFKDIELSDTAPDPPFSISTGERSLPRLAWIAMLAFIGGTILNAMPCVLPVLSIKLNSALKLTTGAKARVRNGLLMTGFGVVSFMWLLAAVVIAAQATGQAIGWGTQFQNPFFLIFLIVVLGLFAANLIGLYEITLPASWSTRLAGSTRGGYFGDFATGAFAAILATPCTAPFLGTAIAFALTGSVVDVLTIFTAMGLGLASPYLLIAARPGLISALPRPGRWMLALKWLLGGLLAGTAFWLFWVLSGVVSPTLSVFVATALLIAILSLALRRRLSATPVLAAITVGALSAAFAAPLVVEEKRQSAPDRNAIAWVPFERAEIGRHVSRGHVVFVDVTADWCLTCKANKSLVLEQAPVANALANTVIIPMQADWTRPDPSIQAFLENNGRFGIPFNIVYGPAAPEGIPLSELLTSSAVMEALQDALGSKIDSTASRAD
jgi:suppressor for copper-sensitivity B